MPSRALLRGFVVLWAVTGAVLLTLSIETARGAATSGGVLDLHALLLGAVEATGAALFLVPPLMRLGGSALLLTIGIAFLLHAAMGQVRGDLLVYAGAVLFVVIHGPLTPDQWRAAFMPSA